jgi:glycerophosphoryl diester phosphodiesterase
LEKKLVTLVGSLAVNTYVVSSFLPEVLQTIYSLRPTVPLGWICDQEQALARWREIPCTVVISEYKLVTQTLIDEIHSAGKKIFVWTVNQEGEMLRLGKAGADAIISDDAGLLGRVFSGLR